MTRQELLRNHADALDWIAQGKEIQSKNIFGGEWLDHDRVNFNRPSVESFLQWRIKPERREFQPGVLRDWLTQDEAFTYDSVYHAKMGGVCKMPPVQIHPDYFKERLVYETREQAEAARRALGWAE